MLKRYCFLILFFSGFYFAKAQDTLTLSDLSPASLLIDMHFTDSERNMMYPDLREYLKKYQDLHARPLDNSIPMSLMQSPRLPGTKFDGQQVPLVWNIPTGIRLPDNRKDLAYYSILQLASLIKNKKISSVELTRFFIDRIKKFADSLQCLISLTEDIAMREARAADAEIAAGKYRGPLHGIPYGLKDLFAVKGTRTTWGAAPYKDQVINQDAYVYLRLKEAGAVLVAKLTLGALAMDDYWFGGQTKNPWNLKTGSSGSSAGSAAATVAGLVPFAIGTETYGSIMAPSHTCGATGLRPSFGAVSRTGAMTLCLSLDKAGPICRSAEDAAIVFAYIHGTDGKDAAAVQMPFNYLAKTDIKKFRVGYAANYFRKTDSSTNEWRVLDVFRRLGVQLVPIEFEDSLFYPVDLIGIIIGSESAAAFEAFTRLNIDDQMTRQTHDDWPNFFRGARFIPAVEYVNANRHRYLLMQKMQEIMMPYDLVIFPTFSGSQMAITNLTGQPALCMPTGFDKQGMPTSITLLGNLFQEAKLLEAGKAFQDATGYEDVHPKLFH